jgi:hypothetical protein
MPAGHDLFRRTGSATNPTTITMTSGQADAERRGVARQDRGRNARFLANWTSPVAAVSRNTDKLDIFATAANGVVQTAAWEPDFGADWHGWWPA